MMRRRYVIHRQNVGTIALLTITTLLDLNLGADKFPSKSLLVLTHYFGTNSDDFKINQKYFATFTCFNEPNRRNASRFWRSDHFTRSRSSLATSTPKNFAISRFTYWKYRWKTIHVIDEYQIFLECTLKWDQKPSPRNVEIRTCLIFCLRDEWGTWSDSSASCDWTKLSWDSNWDWDCCVTICCCWTCTCWVPIAKISINLVNLGNSSRISRKLDHFWLILTKLGWKIRVLHALKSFWNRINAV